MSFEMEKMKERRGILYKEFVEMIKICLIVLNTFLLKGDKSKRAKMEAEGKCLIVLDEIVKFLGKKENDWGTPGMEHAWRGMWIINRCLIEVKMDKVIEIAKEENMERLENRTIKMKKYIEFAAKRYKKTSLNSVQKELREDNRA